MAMPGPLSGTVVVDLSRVLSGPYCTMLLADLGAEVIKIERPGTGDPARRLGPLIHGEAAYFLSVNRGKQSVALDIFTDRGRAVVERLSAQADVLVENYVPGTMARLGLDYATLRRINPRLIYCSISGFGQDGPYARRPALDIVVQAMGGLMSVTGSTGGPPLRPGASLGDSTAGTFAALAITAALYQRQHTGEGQHVDTAMLDCQITLMENAFARYFASGAIPRPTGSRHPAASPFQAFATADGHVVVALLTDQPEPWRLLCEALDAPALAFDPRFATNRQRSAHQNELEPLLAAHFAAQPSAHWLAQLSAAGIPCGPVNNIAQVAADPQVVHRGMIVTVPGHQGSPWQVANSPFRLSGSTTGPQGRAPLLGEHTREVLRTRLGLAEEELGALSRLEDAEEQ